MLTLLNLSSVARPAAAADRYAVRPDSVSHIVEKPASSTALACRCIALSSIAPDMMSSSTGSSVGSCLAPGPECPGSIAITVR